MLNKNDICTIAKSNPKKAVFDKCLNEACRQWCEFIDEAPERRDGIGFSDFFYEVFDEKWKEYFQDAKENGQLCPPSKNGHKKASKNEMNRSISLIY